MQIEGGSMDKEEICTFQKIRERNALKYHPTREDCYDLPWEVDDETVDEMKNLTLGHIITSVMREPSSKEDFPQGANDVVISLDNGISLRFSSWGYDAWGVTTLISPPAGCEIPWEVSKRSFG